MTVFNRNPLGVGVRIEAPDQALVRNTLGLVNASIEDAIRYGGELTRAAIGAMNLRNDRKHLIVDVKVHMLMPKFYAAIPGWHCDGVPRGETWSPLEKAPPRMDVQTAISDGKKPPLRPTRFHMLVTGDGCLTEFVDVPNIDIDLATDARLYADMNRELLKRDPPVRPVPSCQVIEFDWWDIHRGVEATMHEWRYFVRVAEIDIAEPERDLRKVIRTQHQVYAPQDFGW